MALAVVSREEWGAVPPAREPSLLDLPIEYIWLRESHIQPCLSSERCVKSLQYLQKQDMERLGFNDIQANFLIGDDGKIYEGRGWLNKPEYNERWKKYDGVYIEIAYIGPFEDIPEFNSQRMLQRVLDIMAFGFKKRYMIEDIFFLGDPPDFLE